MPLSVFCRTKAPLFLTSVYVCARASCLVRMDGAESALEVLRMTAERAGNLSDWGRQPNWEAKTAEAKALYEDLLPRMELELVKVEEGMCEGRVLYHAYVNKTEDEVVALEQRKVDADALRKKRKEEQEANVRRKEKEKAEKAALEEEMAGRKKRKRDKSKAEAGKSTFDKHFDKKYNVGGINDLAKEKRDKKKPKRKE